MPHLQKKRPTVAAQRHRRALEALHGLDGVVDAQEAAELALPQEGGDGLQGGGGGRGGGGALLLQAGEALQHLIRVCAERLDFSLETLVEVSVVILCMNLQQAQNES